MDATVSFIIDIAPMSFGHTADDGNSWLSSMMNINASFFLTDLTGVATKMTLKVGATSGEGEVRCAIYNEARQLLGETERLQVSGTAWHDFLFTNAPVITPGGYWLATWSNDSHMQCRMKTLSYKNLIATYAVYNGWPSTLPGSPILSAELLINCTVQAND